MNEQVINNQNVDNCKHAAVSWTGDAVMNIYYQGNKFLEQSINPICENFLKEEGLSEAEFLEEVRDIAVSKYPDKGMSLTEAVQSIPAITKYAKYQAKQEVNDFVVAEFIFYKLESMGLGKVKKKKVVGIFQDRIEPFFIPNTDGYESISEISENKTSLSEISENKTSFWDFINDFGFAVLGFALTKNDHKPRNEVENQAKSSAQEKSVEVGKEINKEVTENGGKQLETSNTVNREGHIAESEPESLQSQESAESQNEPIPEIDLSNVSALAGEDLNEVNERDVPPPPDLDGSIFDDIIGVNTGTRIARDLNEVNERDVPPDLDRSEFPDVLSVQTNTNMADKVTIEEDLELGIMDLPDSCFELTDCGNTADEVTIEEDSGPEITANPSSDRETQDVPFPKELPTPFHETNHDAQPTRSIVDIPNQKCQSPQQSGT